MDLSTVSPSPRAQEILAGIADAKLRDDVAAVVRAALGAHAALVRIHLPQDHFEEQDATRAADDKHLDLAPYVLSALSTINHLLEVMGERFEPPKSTQTAIGDDFDLEFDLVDGPTGDGGALGGQAKPQTTMTPREQAADAVYAFGGMLKSRVSSFAGRLRHALSQADSWPLLSELDDYQHGLTKAVQGVLFGVLGLFNDTARREEILPEYRSAVSDAVELRAALTDLTVHVNRTNAAMANATQGQLVPLVVAIADRLGRFAARAEYRTLRAEDKKAVIDFRSELSRLRYSKNGIPQVPLRHAVEGFSKFLEAMQAINHREVLVVHDRQRLLEAVERLEEAKNLGLADVDAARSRLPVIIKILGSVYGRNPDLDEALRQKREPASLGAAEVPVAIGTWQGLCQNALMTVG